LHGREKKLLSARHNETLLHEFMSILFYLFTEKVPLLASMLLRLHTRTEEKQKKANDAERNLPTTATATAASRTSYVMI
jgi:hypothetical protein